MSALAANNQICFEMLACDTNSKFNFRTENANSIYHKCAEFNNVLAFKYSIRNFYATNPNLLVSKNILENTVIHTACSFGNLDIIKLAYESLRNSSSLDKFLYAKNTYGQTFMHIACLKGFSNIVEYFLKELKMITLLEELDNDLNTPLHLSTMKGHAGVVEIILNYSQNVDTKNFNDLTPLQLSCRQGFSQISKNLISHYSTNDKNLESHDNPLHIACFEGIYGNFFFFFFLISN